MSFIYEAITNYYNRDLACASDDCIVTGAREADYKAPLVDIAIGKLVVSFIL
jgi:hypothetical protein